MSYYWDMVRRFDEYLDTGVAEIYKEQGLAQDWARVAKVAEELGEAIQVFIGLTGQNPRKGNHGTWFELYAELADVANTAILAIQHFTKDDVYTSILIHEKLAACLERVGLSAPPHSATSGIWTSNRDAMP